jgi:hypothetical protein
VVGALAAATLFQVRNRRSDEKASTDAGEQ